MFSREGVIEGVAIVFGAILAGLGASILPSFQYSQIVYGIAGLFLVIAAVGWMRKHGSMVSGFVIGLGAGLGTQIYPGITGLVSGNK